jgi:nitrate reductase molybdenum cofactor assembly chaperone NarJ/NarW
METTSLNPWEVVAEAFCYPAPGRLEQLEQALARMPAGPAKTALAAFVEKVSGLALGAWEELHTRTLDLNPPAAPYLGFQTWGESYRRGTFLSDLNRTLIDAHVDAAGELPDHLIPVLRYLGGAAEPLPELVGVFEPAVERMLAVLRKVDPPNPYIALLEAVQALGRTLPKEAA